MKVYRKIKPIFFEKNQVSIRIPMEVVALMDIKEKDVALFEIYTKHRSKGMVISIIKTEDSGVGG